MVAGVPLPGAGQVVGRTDVQRAAIAKRYRGNNESFSHRKLESVAEMTAVVIIQKEGTEESR